MSVCISCGNEIAGNVNFCAHCGAPQAAPAEEKKEAAVEEAAEKVREELEAAEEITEELPAEEKPAEVTVEPEYIPKPAAEEQKKPVFEPVVITPAPAYEPPKAYTEPAREYPQPEFKPSPVLTEDPEKPGKKSKWGIMSTWGYVGATLLMAIPGIGLILTIIWALGGCRKYAKRNYARAALIFLFAGILITVAAALVIRFVFPELIVWAFELLYPGYTIVF